MKNFLKIISTILIICMLSFMLASCNMSFVGKYTFKHIYVETYKTEGHCYTVEKWTDSESGIEVKTKEVGTMFVSEGNYILISDEKDCPYCNKKK